MPSYRVERTAEDIRFQLGNLMRELKDPRISGMLSVVKIDLSSDFSFCKVYVSSLEGIERAKEAVRGLESAAGYIRREIGSRLKLRHVPSFQFVADDSIEHSAEISKLIRELHPGRE
ncbi:MAG TPA: 30S ribosome-binding factor RbfA [Candidatus Fimivivens faecavium]|nr:30S ribosome-binding factor RbfA [Candidatus Fimivivens faecavium]